MPTPSRARTAPWPAQTTPSIPSSSNLNKTPPPSERRSYRRRVEPPAARALDVGDDIPDSAAIAQAENQCQFLSGNDVYSCYPTADTSVAQHQFASFVWNSQRPSLLQTELVNIYLFSATSQTVLLSKLNETNPEGRAGLIHEQVNDTWFGDRGRSWNGKNQTFLYYWVITPNTESLDNRIVPQTTFAAVQTTFLDSVAASLTSAASASSASAAAASRSSESAALSLSQSGGGGISGSQTTGAVTPSGSSSNGGNVQSGAGGSSFPHWAIAVITVLGFLALLAGVILFFVILRCIRRRRGGANLSHRGSMGSAAPMMANADTGHAPTSPVAASGGSAAGGAYNAVDRHRPPSPDVHDGASLASRVSEAALFSGADAAVMANAFRTALRKPNFTDRPDEEGESPDSDPSKREPDLLGAALNEEGRDIRSVGSSRGVRVETLSDAGDEDTIHEHHTR